MIWLQATIERDIDSGTENKMTFAFIVHEHDVFHFPALGASRRNLKETSFSEELYIFFAKPKCTESVAFHACIVPKIANSHDTGQLYFDTIDSLGTHKLITRAEYI